MPDNAWLQLLHERAKLYIQEMVTFKFQQSICQKYNCELELSLCSRFGCFFLPAILLLN